MEVLIIKDNKKVMDLTLMCEILPSSSGIWIALDDSQQEQYNIISSK